MDCTENREMYSYPCTKASCPEMDTGLPWYAYKLQFESKLSPGLCRSHYLSNHSLSFFLLLIQFSWKPTYYHSKVQLPISTRENTHQTVSASKTQSWTSIYRVTEGDFFNSHFLSKHNAFWSWIGSKHLLCGCFKIVHMFDEESFRWPASWNWQSIITSNSTKLKSPVIQSVSSYSLVFSAS